MKRIFQVLALVLVLCFALSACGASKPTENKGTAGDASNAATSEGEASTQIVNPVYEVTQKEQQEQTGIVLSAPDGGENLVWLVIDTENTPLAELTFTLDGVSWCYRGQAGDVDELSVSGMYYEWTDTAEAAVGEYQGMAHAYKGEEEQAVCLTWKAASPDVTYCLSASGTADTEAAISVANACIHSGKSGMISQPADIPEQYQSMINTVQDALSVGSGVETYQEMGISYLWGYPIEEGTVFGYTVQDLNADDIPELIMGTAGEYGMIYDLFSMEDGELLHVLSSGERDRYYLCEGGYLYNEGSGGAALSQETVYCFNGSELELVEAVIYDGEADPENPWFYRSGDMGEDEPNQPITEEEASEKLSGYQRIPLDLTPFTL